MTFNDKLLNPRNTNLNYNFINFISIEYHLIITFIFIYIYTILLTVSRLKLLRNDSLWELSKASVDCKNLVKNIS